MENLLPVGGCGNRNGCILPMAIPMDTKLKTVVPHVPMRLSAKYGVNWPLDGAVLISVINSKIRYEQNLLF